VGGREREGGGEKERGKGEGKEGKGENSPDSLNPGSTRQVPADAVAACRATRATRKPLRHSPQPGLSPPARQAGTVTSLAAQDFIAAAVRAADGKKRNDAQ
jgi:hypothetical protein